MRDDVPRMFKYRTWMQYGVDIEDVVVELMRAARDARAAYDSHLCSLLSGRFGFDLGDVVGSNAIDRDATRLLRLWNLPLQVYDE